MALVNLVDKKVKMQLDQVIKLQIVIHCYINQITMSELDLDCLITLAKLGESELTYFCEEMANKRLTEKLKTWKPSSDNPREKLPESSPQTIRNILIKLEKENLISKKGKGRKKISINPDLKVQTTGNILLNYKFIHLES